jgi:hypothetical protein
MRTGIVVGLLVLLSLPAHAAWLVELTTGETLTVQSYWRDGDQTHLIRGGVDIIVDNDRIKRLEDGAPEPETGLQNATARRDDGEAAVPARVPRSDAKPVEAMSHYRKRLDDMTVDELASEQERASDALMKAQAARFEAKYGGKSEAEVAKLTKDFEAAKQREWAAQSKLKERSARP